MTTVTRRFEWDAAHRVMGHTGKCQHLHGHRYAAEVTVTASVLDGLGMVVDFSVLKEKVGWYIDAEWDHNVMLNGLDPLNGFLRLEKGREPYRFEDGENPTAETIARKLFRIAEHVLAPFNIKVVEVVVWETPNCKATYNGRQS